MSAHVGHAPTACWTRSKAYGRQKTFSMRNGPWKRSPSVWRPSRRLRTGSGLHPLRDDWCWSPLLATTRGISPPSMGSARQRCRVLPAGVGSDDNPHLRCSIAQDGSQFAQKDTMPVAVR